MILALICAAAAILSGLGYRLDLWHFRTGFLILRVAFFVAIAAALLCIAALIVTRARHPTALFTGLIGLLIALITIYIPWSYSRTVKALPFIHDITTDLQNPPEFVAAAKLRKPGDHPVAYDGAEVAAQQQKAYPDVAPFITREPKERVYETALAVVQSMGLETSDANATEGRIEAVDTTLLYGFKDDLVVRITSTTDGTRVDVRSKSRVGRSDVGMNAKRIRSFMTRLRDKLPAQ
jgi:uncharacterized protein (DUF1499 family)